MSELLALEHVSKTYRQRRRVVVTAVDDVSLALGPGEILCLVGESGSGKSTIGRIVTGLTAPTGGEVRHDGRSVSTMTRRELRAHRLGVQLVQQDPFASLNPGLTVAQTLLAPLTRHFGLSRAAARERMAALLADVGLTPPELFGAKYPHELSGGQRQRVAIARSLTVEPRVLVADEAVSMLDVSIRGSVLAKLRALCEERQVAVLFITHDLAVARQFGRGHSIAVMQHGRIVEHRPTSDLVAAPEHEYTRALLAAARHEGLRRRAADRTTPRRRQDEQVDAQIGGGHPAGTGDAGRVQ
ncbi:ABC transporter ATP-binding protein [Jiangella anatolica]|uniref:ABC transporter ATP-binding protein n=1 Tax=Jiangella anatolica TaxID=2670374 RepID=UPI00131416E8|nr:dipeptide/oligopeptide/nickel ABC transporter ATP-binding protein [Jiangella anatolica]